MTIISLSIPDSLVEKIDQKITEKGYASRSEIARQALRLYLSEDIKIDEIDGQAAATITVIYRENADRRKLLETQHLYSGLVSTFLHAHIQEGYCLEVIILKGQAYLIEKFLDKLKGNEDIMQMKVSILNQK
ncbi:MAG: CopG family ribbon-helix-helix protein [Candidatus Bathyarchaeia archaeon]|jgi:CopG family nickel-responsive transcriptional regulator